jgi:hypothetical protein
LITGGWGGGGGCWWPPPPPPPGKAETPAMAMAMKVKTLVSCILKDCLILSEVAEWIFDCVATVVLECLLMVIKGGKDGTFIDKIDEALRS